jgi:hypothetical protein
MGNAGVDADRVSCWGLLVADGVLFSHCSATTAAQEWPLFFLVTGCDEARDNA